MTTKTTNTRADQDWSPLEIAAFLCMHNGVDLEHVVMKMADGTMHWAYRVKSETDDGRMMLVRGLASVVTYFLGNLELQVYRLQDRGKRASYIDDGDIDPTSTLLRDAFLTLDSAPTIDLFIWKGDTTIFNGSGSREYRLLENNPLSRSVDLAGYERDIN